MEHNVKLNQENFGYFLRIMSFSKSYKLSAKQFLFGKSLGVVQVGYQEYDKINEQHIYNISDFLEEKNKQDATIVFKDKNGNTVTFEL